MSTSDQQTCTIRFINYNSRKQQETDPEIIKIFGGLEDVAKKLYEEGSILRARDNNILRDLCHAKNQKGKNKKTISKLWEAHHDIYKFVPQIKIDSYREVPPNEVNPLSIPKISYLYNGSLVELKNNRFTYEMRWDGKDIIISSETPERLADTAERLGLVTRPGLNTDYSSPTASIGSLLQIIKGEEKINE